MQGNVSRWSNCEKYPAPLRTQRTKLRPAKDALTRALGSLKVGSGLDPATRVGPLIDRRSRDQVAQRINEACAAADEVLLAPKIPGEGLAKGAVRGG